MKNIYLLFIFLSSIFAVIHRVPHDRETIQDGINAAEPGDTVLVDEGIYYENLRINKEITLASYFIIDENLSHRDATIIDCHPDQIGENSSCVFIFPPSTGEVISPNIIGFTIQNGVGESVTENIETDDGPVEDSYYIGGGVAVDHCTPVIKYNYFRNNGVVETTDRSGRTMRGGGMMLNNDDDVEFDEDRNGYYATTKLTRDDVIKITNNIFENNYASSGSSVSAYGFPGEVRLDSSVYDIYSEEYDGVSEYWVRSTDGTVSNINSSGTEEALTDDVYVSPSGSNDNDGSSSSPFLTIDYAFSRVYGNVNHPVTVHLLEGEYSANSTGEIFPVNMIRWVSLDGSSMDSAILDGEDLAKSVISIYKTEDFTVSNLMVKGGNSVRGGGIKIIYGSPTITDVKVYNNSASYGGGVYIEWADPILTNVTIEDNSRNGIYMLNSNPKMYNCTITENTTYTEGDCNCQLGGGLYLKYSNPTIIGGEISYNLASKTGGGIYMWESSPLISDVLIHHNEANTESHGYTGGGIQSVNSSPIIINSEIYDNKSNNIGSMGTSGGGFYSKDSDPVLINVLVRENVAITRAGLRMEGGSSTLINVTAVDNNNNNSSEGTQVHIDGIALIRNSIIWGGSNVLDGDNISNITVNYSDIQGGWEGESNINANPEFTGNYDATSSYCIDSGDPNPWYNEEDGTRSNLGWTGGSYFSTSFNNIVFEPLDEYDFGSVGGLPSTVNWRLYNFRETDIVIDGVNFDTESFSVGAEFPMVIGPRETGKIPIIANNSTLGPVEDFMTIISNQLADGLGLNLTVNGSEIDFALSGNLPSYLGINTYTVLGDIYVDAGDYSYIEAGTQILFDGNYTFHIYGTIVVAGTETDSVKFDNLDPEAIGEMNWNGFIFTGVGSGSSLNYVSITGANSEGPTDDEHPRAIFKLENSNPNISNINFFHNSALRCIHLVGSSPNISNFIINNSGGDGIYVEDGAPTITNGVIQNQNYNGIRNSDGSLTVSNVLITDNNWTGIYNSGGNSVFSNLTIRNNSDGGFRGGFEGDTRFDNVEIIGNSRSGIDHDGDGWDSNNGAGIHLDHEGRHIFNRVTVADNIAPGRAGGLWLGEYSNQAHNSPTAVIVNSIFYNNQQETGPSIQSENTTTLVVVNSNIEGGEDGIELNVSSGGYPGVLTWAGGNIDSDPLFGDPLNGDYSLTAESPCVDAGTDLLTIDGNWAIAYGNYWEDNAGDTLVILGPDEYNGYAPDIGAHESNYTAIGGCTDVYAENYNPDATLDDGSCEYLFITHVISTNADNARNVHAVDLDNDGDIDVLSASFDDNKLAWYENDGDQVFTEHVISTAEGGPKHISTCDIDGDGDIDVLTVYQLGNRISWYENDGDQVFTEHPLGAGSIAGAISLDAKDLDSDGDIDILFAARYDHYVGWMENDGDENFTLSVIENNLDGLIFCIAADIDGDGDVDAIVSQANDSPGDYGIKWYENDGNENFTQHILSNIATSSVTVSDIDGDGDMDILSTQSYTGKAVWHENDGSSIFIQEHIITDSGSYPYGIYSADMDADGNLDVVCSDFGENNISWYKNDGSQIFEKNVITTSVDRPYEVFVVDVDMDGDLDVVSASGNDDKIAWHEQVRNPGCTDPEAINYDPDANVDDGSCEYSSGPSEIVVSYNTGWNMVGLPLLVDNTGYLDIYPDAQTNTLYAFDGVYQNETDLVPGTGYLVRFQSEGETSITGTPFYEVTTTLNEGWNIISGISELVTSEQIYSTGLVSTGTLYGYNGVYYLSDTMEPGVGYWARSNTGGELTITNDGQTLRSSNDFIISLLGANKIEISSGEYSSSLYFGIEIDEENILNYSLPPIFEGITFDARFVGDSKVVSESGEIEVVNTTETLTFSYDIKIDAGEHMNWLLTSENGKGYILEGTGEITVPSSETFILNRESVIPVTFALHQNYPNPFNPITTLRYDLPEDALVTLSIYDMLGREITQLVNISQQAGFKSVQWDATDNMGRPVTAGVYIYKIEAGEFVETRKMVLLK